MTTVSMRMPAGQFSLPYGWLTLHANPDGTFAVPMYAVPDLVAAGCTILSAGVSVVDERAELATASAVELRALFLPANGITGPMATDAEAQTAALVAFDAKAKPQTLSSTQFLNRFTDSERTAVFTAAMTSAQMLQFVVTAAAAISIDLTDPAVQAGVNNLVGSILTAPRAAAILDH